MYCAFLVSFMFLVGCGSGDSGEQPVPEPVPEPDVQLTVTPSGELSIPATGETRNIKVTSNAEWFLSSNQKWFSVTPTSGYAGETSLKLTAEANRSGEARTAILTFSSGSYVQTYSIKQETGKEENYVPEGYTLVWQDEFNDARLAGGKPAMPNTAKWYYETGAHGWGNNELQNYVAGTYGTDTCAVITEGTLKITAKKNANQVISIRMNTSESWQYGYFEAKLKLPQGRGTWPAFWMLPKTNKLTWPDDGEIDIMEEVGYRPNWVSSSIHCKAYYHSIGTQKTAEKFIATAESDFHTYAVEWTEESVWGFVDGDCYFKFSNDKTGNKATWPFNVPFYLKLNLAWGGNWGGSQGVDENKLPATYEIDYVRVYQKK
ncbi:Beta-glucanase [termite gut metagenome]|uniref:Beta-glucanase n=1 Tax=termite gut metagenome TaxID=433724 RepID=A0A5J4RA41_9ZZZZ